MKQILIIEDDLDLAEEMASFLQENGYMPKTIKYFSNLKAQILEINPDLILLDINLPEMSGTYLLKELRKKIDTPIIMVTSKNNEMDEVINMSHGADDYITKPFNPQLLLLHIESIFKRMEKVIEILNYKDIQINISKSVIIKNGEEIPLSKNELKIFYFLLKNQGKIVSRDDIMNYLWNTLEFIDDNTLTVNMNRLRKKLQEIELYNVIETRR